MGNVLSYSDTLIDYTTIAGAIVTLTIAISLFTNLHKYPNEMKNLIHKRISTLAITFYTVAMISMCSYHVLTNEKNSLEYVIGWVIFAFCWGNANCLSYMLFILRIKTTFQGTAFKTSSWIYISLYLCVIIFFIANIIVMLIYVLKYKQIISTEVLTQLHTG
eukprot:528144_1